jgi:hypothetical protein
MRFIQFINETYLTLVKGVMGKLAFQPGTKGTGDYAEIFVNPSQKELSSLKSIRFALNFKSKVLVVWNAEVLHEDVLSNDSVWKALKMKCCDIDDNIPEFFSGTGEVISGKIAKVESDGMDQYMDSCEDFWKSVRDNWTKQWFIKPLSKFLIEFL